MSNHNLPSSPSRNGFSVEDISSALCAFLQENILASDVEVTSGTELAVIGVDSFSLMEIVLFIERRFQLILPLETLTPQNTATVHNLSLCCAKVMAT